MTPKTKTKKKPTKAQMRVMVAKDVIAQIKAGKLKPACGSYIDLPEPLSMNPDADLRKELRAVESCEVCALGAAFVAHVKRFNGVTVGDVGGTDSCLLWRSSITDHLGKLFSDKQMDLIEQAFEGYTPAADNGRAEAFYDAYLSDRDRLVAICKNLIRNNGTFTP